MDEDGNEKRVSSLLLTLKEKSEMYILDPCSSLYTFLSLWSWSSSLSYHYIMFYLFTFLGGR